MLLIMMAETGGHAAGGEKASAAFPPFETWHMPGQLFWLAIMFGGLYFILSRNILPKLADTLEKRRDRIASDLDQAARLNEQALDAQKALETSLAQARARARETADKARERTQSEVSAELEKADAEMGKKLAAADARIATLRTNALSSVEEIASDAAGAMLKRLGVTASGSDIKAAVAAVRKG
jgi:F-type H+-transporting ATPase subunit b